MQNKGEKHKNQALPKGKNCLKIAENGMQLIIALSDINRYLNPVFF